MEKTGISKEKIANYTQEKRKALRNYGKYEIILRKIERFH